MNIDTLFLQQNALPTIPKVVQEVIDSFNDDHISIDEISKKLSADQVLSAKLLRLANSSYYHFSRSIGTVDEAVLMLGFMSVRTLVISSGLTGGFKPVHGLDLQQFWHYSLRVAVISKWIAKKIKNNQDFAFLIGLMHAIGQLVMRAAMPGQMSEVDKLAHFFDARRANAEVDMLGYSFFDIGSELAKRWRFPETFSTAIKECASPLASTEFNPVSGVVHVAIWLARARECACSQEEMEATIPEDLLLRLGLTTALILDEMPPFSEISEGLDGLIN
ncbi:HDOD domain-containing protein [Undibacterium sp. SXout7W]|uniref:HDOD domain-containing protein n=1 Tax=Undibacterium sp. SXout7W TaxID=3413049 RepID=UPI003BF10C70